MEKTVKYVLFFILVALLYYTTFKATRSLQQTNDSETTLIAVSVGFGFILTIILLVNNSSEHYWDITPAAQCKGGEYMWQGDSETAKMCRHLAESPDGRRGIASYNCPTGYNGAPSAPFDYAPISDDEWKNARCSANTRSAEPNGKCLSSFEKGSEY